MFNRFNSRFMFVLAAAAALALTACKGSEAREVVPEPSPGLAQQGPGQPLDPDPVAPPPPKARRSAAPETITTDTSVLVVSDLTIAPGQTESASVEIAPLKPWKINTDYPVQVSIGGMTGAASPCMKCSDREPEGAEIKVTSGGARIDIPFTGDAPGTDVVTAKIRYAVCQKSTCVPHQEEVSWRVTVQL